MVKRIEANSYYLCLNGIDTLQKNCEFLESKRCRFNKGRIYESYKINCRANYLYDDFNHLVEIDDKYLCNFEKFEFKMDDSVSEIISGIKNKESSPIIEIVIQPYYFDKGVTTYYKGTLYFNHKFLKHVRRALSYIEVGQMETLIHLLKTTRDLVITNGKLNQIFKIL